MLCCLILKISNWALNLRFIRFAFNFSSFFLHMTQIRIYPRERWERRGRHEMCCLELIYHSIKCDEKTPRRCHHLSRDVWQKYRKRERSFKHCHCDALSLQIWFIPGSKRSIFAVETFPRILPDLSPG